MYVPVKPQAIQIELPFQMAARIAIMIPIFCTKALDAARENRPLPISREIRRVEIEYNGGGSYTGRLYASDGTTLINSLTNDYGNLTGQVERPVHVVRVAVVPGHELGRGVASGQILAGYAQSPVRLCPARKNDRIIVDVEFLNTDVFADIHIAKKREPRLGGLLYRQPGASRLQQ